MPLLELQSVVGGYGDTEILHGVSLQVDAGEVVVIIGPNGAGKSTAMKAVFGLLRLTEGSILLAGEDITNTPPQQVVRKGVCYVPQTANIFPSLTVHENLEMGAFVREDDFSGRLDEIYTLFPPLADKRKQTAGTLSGGQRQGIAIARAIISRAPILILDEPTASMDNTSELQFKEQFEPYIQDRTMLLVTHKASMLSLVDRLVVLNEGKLVADGPRDQVLRALAGNPGDAA